MHGGEKAFASTRINLESPELIGWDSSRVHVVPLLVNTVSWCTNSCRCDRFHTAVLHATRPRARSHLKSCGCALTISNVVQTEKAHTTTTKLLWCHIVSIYALACACDRFFTSQSNRKRRKDVDASEKCCCSVWSGVRFGERS